jgi:hypothetical protein
MLQGPYFESDFIYDKYDYSELLYLVMMSIPKLESGPVEHKILRKWLKELPPHHENISNESCKDLTPIGEKEFDVRNIKPEANYILISKEDFIDSRSHFSPYAVKRSPRDQYLVDLSRKLYERIHDTASKNRSKFKVFYPDRYELDRLYLKHVKCVQYKSDRSTALPIKMDQVSLLKEVLPPENLIVFDLPGGQELSFSETNPHLSDIGNERAMKNLAPLLMGVEPTVVSPGAIWDY